jgi:cardiolipin synthase
MDTTWMLILIGAELVGLALSIHALMSVRTPQGTIAWIVALIAMPILAVPVYWVFGRTKFNGYVFARQAEDEQLGELEQAALARTRQHVVSMEDLRGGIRAVERLARLPFTGGNEVALLIDGDETFEDIVAGRERAERLILFQFYIVRGDELGTRLADALLRKAAEGVRVHFLYDELGSIGLPRAFVRRLEEGGVAVRPFHSTRGTGNRFQLNFRNHRKIVVVDERVGWVGGHNVGDEYLGKDPKIGAWRDTHMRIEGPAVMGLQVSFFEDWNWATGEQLDLDWEPRAAPGGDAQVLVVPTGPTGESEAASLLFQHAIHSAQERVWIATPYFVPDEGVQAALKIARLRGVDVRVLIPDKPDSRLVYMSAFAFVGEMLASGIEVHRYEPGFLHQKVMLIDDSASAVGTANLDNRSFRLNFEVTAIVLDEAFAADVERMLRDDLARSTPMTREQLDAKPFWFRAAARAAYLSAPIQ